MRVRFPLCLIFVLLLLIPLSHGQDSSSVIEPADDSMVNPSANISYPKSVYVVRGSVDIRGTADLPDQLRIFIEFRPLSLDTMEADPSEEAPWFPATLPQLAPVVDGVLGTWNTLTARDGIYELRLTIVTSGGQEQVRVSPVRVENHPPDFVVDMLRAEIEAEMQAETDMEMGAETEMEAEAEPMETPEPEAEAEPMQTPEPEPEPAATGPRVIAQVNSNVRSGDSTFHHVVGFLMAGGSADILGISIRGTGWFYIRLENGVQGYIHPNIVSTEGDISNLEFYRPPPLPPTPIPLPTVAPPPPAASQPQAPAAQPPPSGGANLRFGEIKMDPHPAECNKAYKITVTVSNNGNADAGGFAVEVRDSLKGTGQGQATTLIGFPPIPAHQSRTATGHLTQSQYYNDEHHVNLYLDVRGEVAETDENDNRGATAAYILKKGSCP